MHLPDGFLDGKTALLTAGAAGTGIALALRQVKQTLAPRQTPMLGLAAAFIFAAQMINFPVLAGTSGHLVGGVLAGVLLGPAAAVIVMTCVLMVQCLMFNDGGLLALGANVFNMGIVNVWGGDFVFRLFQRMPWMEPNRATLFAASFAAWFGTVLASLTCAGEIACSGTAPWGVTFPAMASIHILIGLGEGLLTGLVLTAVLRARPELVAGWGGQQRVGGSGFLSYGLLVSLGLAVFVAPLACPWPDGLEAVAKTLGFEHRAAGPLFPSPLGNYHLPFIRSAATATALAGVAGILVAFIGAWLLASRLVPKLAARKDHANSQG